MQTAERSPSLSSSHSRRRFLSRITSPFGAKGRNLHDYYISLDDPHKQYSGGDQVTGTVHLKVNKAVRITHLVVCLHGFAQVYKNPGVPPTDHKANAHIGTGRSKSGEYFGNGFASLFEDEVVLCGDGKLDPGDYQFQFEVEFPDRELPSNISFERGTISYLITASLTRPTTISPVLQCEKRVYFVQKLDISNILPPKPRTITLEPISRRTRAKTHARKLVDNDRKSRKTDSNSTNQQSNERRASQTSSSPSLQAANGDNVNSPSPSEISFDSLTGSQGPGSQQGSNATSPRPSDAARSKISIPAKTITTEVELLMGGCLRGDHVPVRVHVNHTKHVKSLHGVIITLYRQALVDLHPTIPIGPTEKGKGAKYEDYYPRSMTGLGGLSLSGAGSSHKFRKDLSQTVVPLIVDRSSLTAEVTGKVHVPDEAFTTISTVPGSMISFRYYVEVVVDIQGKLSSQDRNFGNLGGLASTMNQVQTQVVDPRQTALNPLGSPVIDTDVVKRDKGVVYCIFEIAVGTHDSERRKGKRKVDVTIEETPDEHDPLQQQERTQSTSQYGNGSIANGNGDPGQWNSPEYDYYDAPYYDPGQYYQQGYAPSNGYHDQESQEYAGYGPPPLDMTPVPMPQIEDTSQLSEKERLRRAEAQLLPSQPPGVGDRTDEVTQPPTAPYLPDEQMNGYNTSHPNHLSPPAVVASSSRTAGMAPVPIDFASNVPLPATPRYEATESAMNWTSSNPTSTPTYEARERDTLLSGSSLSPTASRTATDDKRELERHRLQMEASAPPMDEAESSVQSTAPPLPSAPVLMEDDDLQTDLHDSHADASGSSELPRYER